MAFLPGPVKAVTSRYPEEAATELYGGTLKLHYSSTPFSQRFPSWLVADLSSSTPVVGPGPGSRIHFPDRVLVCERTVKRFRITGKSAAGKRSFEGFGEPPPSK